MYRSCAALTGIHVTGVVKVARKREAPPVIRLTSEEVYDPEAVQQGYRTWAVFLGEHLRRRLGAQSGKRKPKVSSA